MAKKNEETSANIDNPRKIYVADTRIYEDPQNPTTSPYDIVLPVTSLDAIIDLDKLINQMQLIVNSIADKIDLSKLDVKVSTRAPENTALSNKDWTNNRAALLDNLNQNLANTLGAVNAKGGTATAGSANAKLNTLIENIANLISNISTMYGALGNSNDKNGNATSGTVNAKLNALFANLSGLIDTINLIANGTIEVKTTANVKIHRLSGEFAVGQYHPPVGSVYPVGIVPIPDNINLEKSTIRLWCTNNLGLDFLGAAHLVINEYWVANNPSSYKRYFRFPVSAGSNTLTMTSTIASYEIVEYL
ncbi:MAG: hypothetical protein FWG64_03175 [Firmicutes bacterium]|nr:hypothetical protein [Bacillota bacterium]